MNTPLSKKLLFVSRKAPYGSSMARDALDALLAASVYDQDLSVLFMGDGVFQLVKDQAAHRAGMKSLAASLPALPLYDIEKIYVQQSALEQRGLADAELVIPATALEDGDITDLMEQQEAMLSF